MLSKSDFKIASSCPKKLVYKKSFYKTKNDENEYLEMLAAGGHVVARYAQLMYPYGIEVTGSDIDAVLYRTKQLLEQKNIVLFEATFLSDGKIVRTDILEKKGNVINIIEVKSKSFDSEDEDDNAKKKLKEHIEDVAFQTIVVKECYPALEIHSFLLVPDKSKRTAIEGLAGWFTVTREEEEKFEVDTIPAGDTRGFRKPVVEFVYENYPDREKYIDQLISDNILTKVNVDYEVAEVISDIKTRSDLFLNIINNGIAPEQYSISKSCRDCEFHLDEEQDKNGYRECWGDMTDTKPHIFDLYYGGSIGGHYLDELITNRKVSFWDLDTERFRNASGDLGSRGLRQIIQYENTKSNTEWISPDLKDALLKLDYPLHFIDFETYLGAIPHHLGMRPYEVVTFQWSCHTLTRDGSIIHTEYLNDDHSFPNFRFAASLMDIVGTTGTPLMWSSYENTQLRTILQQMEVFGYDNQNLKNWLLGITTDKKQGRTGRFVDLNDFCLKYYFHPEMKGRTSIKKVLPAIWNNNPSLHANPWFKKYAPTSELAISPYDTLAKTITEMEQEEVVKDGTGAMRAYHELMFGVAADNTERRENIKKLLLQYCELDTMAMVIIWKYWMEKCGL